ncbi:MAG: alpha/beta hydrolase [Acidimicrobiales bacterium]|jgi:pimeloyl-ACP methyl ester carboxylesterase|nr:alpha/beta hydrolase [Acidimicrobiales bacterium]
MRLPSTSGVDLAVHDLGGDGPAALMVHANGLHGLVWPVVAERIPDRHCWSVDLRAHGDSPLPVGVELGWSGFVDDVLAVVDGLGLERPFGIGHSLGGAALVMAELRRPGTFRALWCFEPVIMPAALITDEPIADNPMSAGARRRRDRFPSFAAAVANYASKPPFDALDPRALEAYVAHGFADDGEGSVRLKCAPEHEAEIFARGSVSDAFLHLHEVACPVTVAVGDTSGPGPAAFAADIAAALPQGHLQAFPDAGHFAPLEDPAAVALGIRQAFAGL